MRFLRKTVVWFRPPVFGSETCGPFTSDEYAKGWIDLGIRSMLKKNLSYKLWAEIMTVGNSRNESGLAMVNKKVRGWGNLYCLGKSWKGIHKEEIKMDCNKCKLVYITLRADSVYFEP